VLQRKPAADPIIVLQKKLEKGTGGAKEPFRYQRVLLSWLSVGQVFVRSTESMSDNRYYVNFARWVAQCLKRCDPRTTKEGGPLSP